jgi:EAL domain-containing protein (putative c-di-GMP-specific phosphodiesterase class I)/methyl-accepting chemotaxis protein
MIFTGNFLISVKNTKEYLEVESISKTKDTATSLGMALKPLLADKKDPEIKSIIYAIANSGFYKEIRLEDAFFRLTESDIVLASSLERDNWIINDLKVEPKYGQIDLITSDEQMNKELLELESDEVQAAFEVEAIEKSYSFTPNIRYDSGGKFKFFFTATNDEGISKSSFANLDIHRTIVNVERDEKFDYVPQWFLNMISIELEEQSSEISDGWKTTAVLYISANAGDAYAKLYEQVKSAIIYSIIAFIIATIILFVFVQYLLKPLKRMEKLATNISNGKFELIKDLPVTTEIKSVAIAMNNMSSKIESVISRLNKDLKTITKKLAKDELTTLNLEQSFETDMKNMFINKSNGYIFVIKIYDLGSFAKSHTNDEVNEFIKSFAKILKKTKHKEELETSSYRFFGSEFALIGKEFTYEDSVEFNKELQKEFELLGKELNKPDIVHIGATPFNPIGTTPQILQAAKEAYEKATLIGPNEAFITNYAELSRDMASWRDLVFDIIDNSKFELNYIGDAMLLKENHELVMQEAFAKTKDKDGNDIPIGTFVSIAERYEKIIDFDKKVIEKVIDYIKTNNIQHEISINLSLESINNTAFIAWIEEKIKENSSIAKQLVFSITAYAVAKDIGKFKFFADEIHNCGAKIIVKRFETKFISLDELKDLNLDYIRLARNYTSDLTVDESKQKLVKTVQELSELLSIKLFAENVEREDDLEILKLYNLYGASR